MRWVEPIGAAVAGSIRWRNLVLTVGDPVETPNAFAATTTPDATLKVSSTVQLSTTFLTVEQST